MANLAHAHPLAKQEITTWPPAYSSQQVSAVLETLGAIAAVMRLSEGSERLLTRLYGAIPSESAGEVELFDDELVSAYASVDCELDHESIKRKIRRDRESLITDQNKRGVTLVIITTGSQRERPDGSIDKRGTRYDLTNGWELITTALANRPARLPSKAGPRARELQRMIEHTLPHLKDAAPLRGPRPRRLTPDEIEARPWTQAENAIRRLYDKHLNRETDRRQILRAWLDLQLDTLEAMSTHESCGEVDTASPFVAVNETLMCRGQTVRELEKSIVSNAGIVRERLEPQGAAPQADPQLALEACKSVGAEPWKLITLDDARPPDKRLVTSRNTSFDDLAAKLDRDLESAERARHSLAIRITGTPAAGQRHTTPTIQIGDLDRESVDRFMDLAFMVIETSPLSYQAWLAIDEQEDETQEALYQRLCDLRARILAKLGQKQGNGESYGCVRWPGSRNWKPVRRRPDGSAPLIKLRSVQMGKRTSEAELEAAGLLAEIAVAAPRPPSVVHSRPGSDWWPDLGREYQRFPDRSTAEASACMIALKAGRSIEAVEAWIAENGAKALARGEAGRGKYVRGLVESAARKLGLA